MADVFDFKGKKVKRRGGYEYCVICWQRTEVKFNEPIQKRKGYIH